MSSIKKETLAGGKTSWIVRYRDDEDKSVERRFRTRADAERFEVSVKHAIYLGEYVDPKAGKVAFRTVAEDWRCNAMHSANTVMLVKSRLYVNVYPTLGGRPIASIRPADIQKLVKTLSATLAPSTVEGIYSHVATIFGDAVDNRIITKSPCVGIKLPKAQKRQVVPLPEETVHAIFELISRRFRNLARVAAGTGMRQGELFGLTIDRVDFLRNEIRIDRQVQLIDGQPQFTKPKSLASYRTIPVPEAVLDAIADQIERYGLGPDGLVFTGRTGQPLRRSSFHSVWAPLNTAFGLPKGTGLHALRHFYASMLIRAGASVKVVQERLGHASAMETLDTYAHIWADDDDRTRNAVRDFFDGPGSASEAA